MSFGSVSSAPRSLLSPVAALSPPPRPAGAARGLPPSAGAVTPAAHAGHSRLSLGFGASRIHASGGSATLDVSGVSDFSLTMADSRDIANDGHMQQLAASDNGSGSEMEQSDSE